MFRNVLIGVDGQSGGRDAITLAREIAAPDAVLTLANVYAGALPVVPAVVAWDETESDRAAEVLQEELAWADTPAEVVSTCAASAGEGLHRLGEQLHADLLVVGSSNRGLIGRVLLGDDARASLNGAPCAVAIAPRHHAQHPGPIARIGVGYDGTDESVLALAAARSVAERYGSAIEVLDVIHAPVMLPPAPGSWAAVLPDLLQHATEAIARLEGVTGTAVAGVPTRELVDLGHRVDLLVLGSRGYGPFRRMMFGSTSGYLQRHAPCPVLVVPRGTAGGTGSGPEAGGSHPTDAVAGS